MPETTDGKLRVQQHSVAHALKKYGRELSVSKKKLRKKRFRGDSANAFLLGVLFDRSINADRAWLAARKFNESLGDADDISSIWRKLAKMKRPNLEGFMR